MQDIIKIGRTANSLEERLRSLSKPSGIPVAFNIEYAVFSFDSVRLEKILHAELSIYRINPRREFFKIDIMSAKTILRYRNGKVCKEYRTKLEDLGDAADKTIIIEP